MQGDAGRLLLVLPRAWSAALTGASAIEEIGAAETSGSCTSACSRSPLVTAALVFKLVDVDVARPAAALLLLVRDFLVEYVEEELPSPHLF